ncbi:MAG: NAD(P)H-dependent oxidoreductase [Paludibacteraceae bacterium]|nr:NAD(P)H-dependent oxidoreductase [Paludibacteraceae bacterium]
MKRILFIALAAMMLLPVSAQNVQKTKKTMVVYFSATGTTKAAAQRLAREHKATLWEIEPAEKYTAADLDWRNKKSRSSVEMNDPEARPTIKQCTNILPYDTIYVGFPIWWGICPRIINSWIDNNLPQLEGKVLIPFATSGSSGIEGAEAYLKKTYPTLKWKKGKLMNKH